MSPKSHKKTGIAGEYATYAELHRIGFDPNLADPNEPVFDLLARMPGNFNKTAYIQVKTRGKTSQAGWRIGSKAKVYEFQEMARQTPGLFVVLVDEKAEGFSFYVFKAREFYHAVIDWMVNVYLKQRKRDGSLRSDKGAWTFEPEPQKAKLDTAKDNWWIIRDYLGENENSTEGDFDPQHFGRIPANTNTSDSMNESKMNEKYYLRLRNTYLPSNIGTVFILESPPASGKYFYDETGSVGEPLFSAMMKLLNFNPENKREGLKFFSAKGCFLVDATYEPVNMLKGKIRDNTILMNFGNLAKDLKKLGDPQQIDFILIKANVCRLLESRLLSEGINVINKGVIIPFPSSGQQRKFFEKIRKVFMKRTRMA